MVDFSNSETIDRLTESFGAPALAYMFPEPSSVSGRGDQGFASGGRAFDLTRSDIFVFQYFPEQLSDEHQPEYATKRIPGGSHPLYQYVGGQERTLSFTAIFTAEVEEETEAAKQIGLPSARYTVDVRAAIARLTTFKMPTYRKGGLLGVVEAPTKLVLILGGSNLGGDRDEILTILMDASYTYEDWFPSGAPRIASVNLRFAECVQHGQQGDVGSRIEFIGADRFAARASKYKPANGGLGGSVD